MELASILNLIRRSIRPILATVAAAAIAAFALSSVLPATYTSEVRLLVGSPRTSDYDVILASQLQAQTYAELATSRTVLEVVAARTGEPSIDDLRNKIEVRTPRSTPFIDITVSDPSPDLAAVIANAVGTALIDLDPLAGEEIALLTVVDEAVPATAPSAPRPILNAFVAGVAGFMVAVFVVWAVDARRGSGPAGR